MTPSRRHLPLLLLLFSAAIAPAADADHSLPVPVPDEFGLGERLALIDWLRERKIVVPDQAELPALRRMYLEALAAAKPVDPQEARRREEAEKLRLQLWREFSVNAEPSATPEQLQRQMQELQAQRQAADAKVKSRDQEEAAAPPITEAAPPRPSTGTAAAAPVTPPQAQKREHPVDRLFTQYASDLDQAAMQASLIGSVARVMERGEFPVDREWTPDERARHARLVPLIERLSDSWSGLASVIREARHVSLHGPDPAGEQAATLRRRLIERAVHFVGEPVGAQPEVHQLWQRWSAAQTALALDQGIQAQHWLVVADREWARALIPDLLTSMERDADLVMNGGHSLEGIATWCLAMAPPDLVPRFLALADRIQQPVARLWFLDACPTTVDTTARQGGVLATIDDQFLESLRSNVRPLRDARLVDVVVGRLLRKPGLDQYWHRLGSWPMNPATCARMIDEGLRWAPTLAQPKPDPRAAWLVVAARNPAVRGCLGTAQRTALETARAGATGTGQLLLTTVRISEEPERQRRAELIGSWLQVVAREPDKERWGRRVTSTLVKGLWLERGRLPDEVLEVLRGHYIQGYDEWQRLAQRILVRHGTAGDPPAPPPAHAPLAVHLAAAFDPATSPQRIVERLTSTPTIPVLEAAEIARVLPDGTGQAWMPTVLEAFERWWEATTEKSHPGRGALAAETGMWAATSGSREWAMIWARRVDVAAMMFRDGAGQLDGSLIFLVADPQHLRSRAWVEEQERVRSGWLPLIRWVAEGRTRPLPTEIPELTGDWSRALERLVPQGAAGAGIIAPLLDVRLAFSDVGEHPAIWPLLLSRQDP